MDPYTSKDVDSFQRRFRFTAKLSRSTEMFHISFATTHAYPPLFPYVFSIFHNCKNWTSQSLVPWSYSQYSHSKHHIQRCAHAQLSFWNSWIILFEHVLCKVWQDNGAWPRCLKPWLTCASAFFGEVLGCTLLGPAQWWLLSSRPQPPWAWVLEESRSSTGTPSVRLQGQSQEPLRICIQM